MQKATRLKLIIFNLIFILIIIADCILPGRISEILELDSIYQVTVKTNSGPRPSFVDRNILLLTSGETCRISKIPDGEYQKGQKIRIVKGAFTGNIKEILFLDKKVEKKSVGIFLNNIIFYFFLVAIVVSLLSIVYNDRILSLLLVPSSLFLFVFGIGYLLG
ncbi:MAG: hypothetical protein EOP00_27270 [Pedobacter sp.]|nr:MAG: hypothetical protein EOP00_27270 [Pedobacter sp.]